MCLQFLTGSIPFSKFFSVDHSEIVWREYSSPKNSIRLFIQPQNIIQHSDDLTKLRFNDPSTHLPDDELYVGDSTTALLVHLNENECELMNEVYKGVIRFYQRFVQKQLQKFNFKSTSFRFLILQIVRA